jgi:hypothetical protein
MLQRRFNIELVVSIVRLLVLLIVFARTGSGIVTAADVAAVFWFVNDNSVAISPKMLCTTALSNNSE